jgi:hypothetical protein
MNKQDRKAYIRRLYEVAHELDILSAGLRSNLLGRALGDVGKVIAAVKHDDHITHGRCGRTSAPSASWAVFKDRRVDQGEPPEKVYAGYVWRGALFYQYCPECYRLLRYKRSHYRPTYDEHGHPTYDLHCPNCGTYYVNRRGSWYEATQSGRLTQSCVGGHYEEVKAEPYVPYESDTVAGGSRI